MFTLIGFAIAYLLTFNLWFAVCIALIIELVAWAIKIASEEL